MVSLFFFEALLHLPLTYLELTPLHYGLIAGGAALLILIIVLAVILGKKKRGPKKTKRAIDKSAYMEALGGEGNVISHIRKGSRIELKLNDYEALDKEKLKEAGVDGFIKMSDRLTLVIKGDAEAVEKTLFGSSAS